MKSILVFGIAVIDFVFKLDAFPDKPIKYRAEGAEIVGGGCAANACVAIARLEGDAKLVARLGQDEIGDLILSDLKREGVDCQFAKQFEGHRSSFSSVFIDKTGERQIVNFRDTSLPDAPSWLTDNTVRPDAILADTRWPEGACYAMQLARQLNIPGVLDAEDQPQEAEDALGHASHVAFSENGLKTWAEHAGHGEDLAPCLAAFKEKFHNWVCVTRGSGGVIYMKEDEPISVPAYKVDAIDTLGAGDIWHGAFSLGLAEEMPVHQAIVFANATAAIKCTRFGGRMGTPKRDDVIQFMKDQL